MGFQRKILENQDYYDLITGLIIEKSTKIIYIFRMIILSMERSIITEEKKELLIKQLSSM